MIDINQTAPPGQIFICGACGKRAKRRVDVGDESCWMYSVLVYEDSVSINDKGEVTAKAVLK